VRIRRFVTYITRTKSEARQAEGSQDIQDVRDANYAVVVDVTRAGGTNASKTGEQNQDVVYRNQPVSIDILRTIVGEYQGQVGGLRVRTV